MAVFNNVLAGAAGQGGAAFSIERSLRFSRDDSAYLNRTPSSASNRRTWTWSAWVKRSYLTVADYLTLFGAITSNASEYSFLSYNTSADTFIYFQSSIGSITTEGVFRDNSAWAHICLAVDTTQSTLADAFKIYVNGSLVSTTSSGTHIQNLQTSVNSTQQHCIGSNLPWQGRYFDGYIAETYLIDGQALAASDFGEYDDDNVWQPKEYSGTYGTNGWHLDFSDATSTTTIAEDSSGNGNDWTANNISVTAGSENDSLFDSPSNGTQSDTGAGGEVSGNYCTFNNAVDASHISSNGALEFIGTTQWNSAFGTMLIPSSGKWYYEMTAGGANNLAGIVDATGELDPSSYIGTTSVSYLYNFGSGNKIQGSSNTQTAYGATGGNGDVMGIAFDMDAGTLTFYKNGTSQGTAFTGLTGSYLPVMASYPGSGGLIANFGQRPFAYAAPSGYKCLCSANLPDPTIADGSTGMDVALYSGNDTGQTISGLNFSPDLVWIKSRTQTRNNMLADSMRGVGKDLVSNLTGGEATNSDGLTAFNSDGFTVGADQDYNVGSGNTYVAWAWDAGSSTASNTDGSITSSVKANTSTGFSVLTADIDSSGGTIGHGLNASPGLIIGKNRDSTSNWGVWHSSISTSQYLLLNSTAAVTTSSTIFNGVSSTTFTVGSGWSTASTNHVFYCFAPVEGYSAFGKYTGNGDADGPFIYTGFRPNYIMVKSLPNPNSWYILDAKRSTDNPAQERLLANLTNAESSSTDWLDILSNGFKIRTTNAGFNGNTYGYIYAAFAEHPFKTARAR